MTDEPMDTPDEPPVRADRAGRAGDGRADAEATPGDKRTGIGAKAKPAADPRAERLAAALRANLARRKAAARAGSGRESGGADKKAD